ncbi:MAG: hypothetical protein GXO47_10950 [Chlorobi bacterium]|nr:hypothetical protein [Chlorobiota bacterium]
MKYILAFTITLLAMGYQCKSPQMQQRNNIDYIFDSQRLFEKYSNKNDTLNYIWFSISKTIQEYYSGPSDTFLIAENYKIYELIHYLKYNEYKDTFYVKHISFLDSIRYFDNKWLQSEEHLDSLWAPVKNCWRCSGIYDTAKTFLILPIKNKDSVVVMQVHKRYHQTLK